jgi:hypothetical protein
VPQQPEGHDAEAPRGPKARLPRQAGPGDRRAAPAAPRADARLLAPEDRAELTSRLQDALNVFVDDPGEAVRAADAVVADAVARITAGLQEHRHAARSSWAEPAGDGAVGTEELRLALRQYRDLAQRLLAG